MARAVTPISNTSETPTHTCHHCHEKDTGARYPKRMPWDGQQSGAASVRAYSYMAGTQDEVSDQEQQQAAACDS